MYKRNFASFRMPVALAVSLTALLLVGQALSKDDRPDSPTGRGKGKKVGHVEGRPAGWQEGNKEGWKTEFPPGWEKWDGAKRQQWQDDLGRAKNAVRKHTQARLDAALRALETAARNGAPLDQAENMAKAGLERGLGPLDFEPLGKFVVERVKNGVKGRELAMAIHEEVSRRQQQRQRLREEMKEKNKQSQEERKRQREKLKEKRESEKQKRSNGKSLDKGSEGQEKGGGRHGRSQPGAEKGRGKSKAAKEKKTGRKPN